jgi:hypothetical protein
MFLNQTFRSKMSTIALCILLPLSFTACRGGGGSNPATKGVDGIMAKVIGPDFVLTANFKFLNFDQGASLPIDIGGGYVGQVSLVQSLDTNGMLFRLSIPSKAIFAMAGGAVPADPLALPGSSRRPLPGIAKGVMMGLAFEFTKLGNIVLYASQSVFGIFVPVKIYKTDIQGTFNFYGKNAAGQSDKIGSISIIGSREDTAGVETDPAGFFIGLKINSGNGANALKASARLQ